MMVVLVVVVVGGGEGEGKMFIRHLFFSLSLPPCCPSLTAGLFYFSHSLFSQTLFSNLVVANDVVVVVVVVVTVWVCMLRWPRQHFLLLLLTGS